MHISNIVIKNFRALEDLHCDFGPHINVIVGPNAVGKTTVLQALRLVKALLAPRSQNEAQQTLISLGAASPHFPQRIFLSPLVRNPANPIEIRCTYFLTDEEIASVADARLAIVQTLVQSRLGQSFANPASLIQFLGSSQGRLAIENATAELIPVFDRLRSDKTLILGVVVDASTGQIRPIDNIAGSILGFLDQRLPPHQTIFSYFPADRALPFGETQVQLGAADTTQQLEAHNSQPQLKYTRLKTMIFNAIVMGTQERDSLMSEFEKIFTGILHGRRIQRIGVNELGMLSIMTEDIETGTVTEIDNLSSGEKNLVLTFLLIAKSIARGGIVLFDEPELHLNPLVCKEFLTFLLHGYSKPGQMQFIICTHSPEILSGAFSTDDCLLFHVKSAAEITRVGRRAIDEYSDALQKLGTSVSESLLYEGTVLVEGDDDVSFLEIGFSELLKRYKIKDRGGRREVEKTARQIQELESRGEKVSPIFIITDRDDELTSLMNSDAVRVLQWERRCMENYLIDLDVITELLKRNDVANTPISSEGEVAKVLRELALTQLEAIAARQVYQSFGYRSPALWAEDIEKKPLADMAQALFARLQAAQESLVVPSESEWVHEFMAQCQKIKAETELVWEAKWKELCDGKRLFQDFQKTGHLRISISAFKRRIIQHMKDTSSENWRLAESLLKGLIGKPVA
jgi:predicted ATPase